MKYIKDNDIIDLSYVQDMIEMNKRKELLAMHTHEIWEGKDGKWRTYLPDSEKGRKLIKKKDKKTIENAIVDYWRTQLQNPTIREVFKEWNDRRLELKKISASTHERYKQTFDRHYQDFGNKRIKSVEWEEFEEFLEEQIAEYELSAKAFSGLKGITKGFLQRAKKRKLINFDVVTKMNELDVSDSEFKRVIKEDWQEVYNEEELPAMMAYLKDNLDTHNIGILLMFITGIRIGELVALKHSDFEGNTIRIRRTETRYKSNGKNVYEVKEFPKSKAGVRTVIIPESYTWVANKIKVMNPFGEYIFLQKSGERMTTNCIRRRLHRVNEKVHAVQKSPHKCRKTYASILLDNNIDERLVTDLMGHTTVLCTENHYHRNRRAIDAKSKIISNIPEFMAQ